MADKYSEKACGGSCASIVTGGLVNIRTAEVYRSVKTTRPGAARAWRSENHVSLVIGQVACPTDPENRCKACVLVYPKADKVYASEYEIASGNSPVSGEEIA